MKYHELLELYKKKELSEEQREMVEQDLNVTRQSASICLKRKKRTFYRIQGKYSTNLGCSSPKKKKMLQMISQSV